MCQERGYLNGNIYLWGIEILLGYVVLREESSAGERVPGKSDTDEESYFDDTVGNVHCSERGVCVFVF